MADMDHLSVCFSCKQNMERILSMILGTSNIWSSWFSNARSSTAIKKKKRRGGGDRWCTLLSCEVLFEKNKQTKKSEQICFLDIISISHVNKPRTHE